jgi:TPR repeat protein
MTVANAQDAAVTACDTHAASSLDPQRKAAGIPDEKINPALAIPACVSALRSFPNSPRLKYQLGRAYRSANNFREAIAWFRQAARSGYAPAEAVLGYMSQFGEGIPQNYRDAISWYTNAANHDFAPAQNNLGMIYENGLAGC